MMGKFLKGRNIRWGKHSEKILYGEKTRKEYIDREIHGSGKWSWGVKSAGENNFLEGKTGKKLWIGSN